MTTKRRFVRATAPGFYPAQRRKAGDVFALREGDKPASWMVEVDPMTREPVAADAPPAPVKGGERPSKIEEVKTYIRRAAAEVDMTNPDNLTKTGLPTLKALEAKLGWKPEPAQVQAALKGAGATKPQSSDDDAAKEGKPE